MSNRLLEITDITDLRDSLREIRKSGKSIGLVPTMGYLHKGHISLVEKSVSECDYTVVSIFVNPAQFAPTEDFDKYPRDYEKDKNLLQHAGTDLIFYPSNEIMYPETFSTWIIEDKISKILCGKTRPTHFRGVLTIVAKLFNLVQPDVAYFGQKDYQQAVLISKMVSDLNIPVRIEICPIVREPDGLAMSSRNNYLKEEERSDALVYSKTLNCVNRFFYEGITSVDILIEEGKKYFTENCGSASLEYLEIRDAENLDEIQTIDRKSVALIAGHSGPTRLIDNLIPGSESM
jgi:pantoate--beta-alanine ligase